MARTGHRQRGGTGGTAAPSAVAQMAEVVPELVQQAAGATPQVADHATVAKPVLARPERARDLRAAASQIDLSWARSWPARFFRENFLSLVMSPLIDHYAARRYRGFEKLRDIKGPVILVANHSSHMDTPVILSALPRNLRRRTAVAAAADYFYRKKWVGALASLLFNTVPLERSGGGLARNGGQLDELLDDGWSLLMFPEGTRARTHSLGRMRRGAAVLAAKHNLTIVPIRVEGTQRAMPPGQLWPRRLRSGLFRRRYPVEVSFGDPIAPLADSKAMIAQVQKYFEERESAGRQNWHWRHSSAGD